MDTSAVGLVAAELMESIANQHDDAEVGTVAVVVELSIPPSDDEPEGATVIRYRCTDGRRWIQAGLLEQARRAVFHDDEED